ncbi:helix-turn-helix domain-containing protein [Candidatus Frankia nodulisporulans]|uniref:helix-turn-helix domain-containing protein n=1 Tax=Candidatus Frankia nodulisporulans TaxID=2060052 RepID=UPI0013D8D7EA|nr:helix-turn-helix domain-containing protein [Candidatus Frankia nodulisporulans]
MSGDQVPDDLIPRVEVPARWPVISPRMARRLTAEQRIPSWTVGRRVFVSAGDVESWLAACRRPAA